MDKVDLNKSILDALAQKKSTQSQGLMGQLSNKKNSSTDSLLSLASKRQKDRLMLTQYSLKQRLAEDLEATIATQMSANPEMKGQFFIAFVRDEKQAYTARVVDFEKAVAAVSDTDQETARQVLSSNPIGYFNNPEDFTLETKDDPSYKEFEGKLNDYFKRNHNVITYLQENPESNVNIDELYKKI